MSRRKLYQEPEPVEPQPVEEGPAAPKWRVEANAIYSTTYRGKVDLGTYIKEKDAVKRRDQSIAEGYKDAVLVEVLG